VREEAVPGGHDASGCGGPSLVASTVMMQLGWQLGQAGPAWKIRSKKPKKNGKGFLVPYFKV
jgi:hypothetical protein